jgi:hypothetical protein
MRARQHSPNKRHFAFAKLHPCKTARGRALALVSPCSDSVLWIAAGKKGFRKCSPLRPCMREGDTSLHVCLAGTRRSCVSGNDTQRMAATLDGCCDHRGMIADEELHRHVACDRHSGPWQDERMSCGAVIVAMMVGLSGDADRQRWAYCDEAANCAHGCIAATTARARCS